MTGEGLLEEWHTHLVTTLNWRMMPPEPLLDELLLLNGFIERHPNPEATFAARFTGLEWVLWPEERRYLYE